jgi:hypothetical protein
VLLAARGPAYLAKDAALRAIVENAKLPIKTRREALNERSVLAKRLSRRFET